MTIPLSSTTFSAVVTGASLVGIASELDASCMIGAFAGAVVFVISAADFPILKRWLLFFVSFLTGIVASNFTAALISVVISHGITVDKSIGALIASASAVRILMMFAAKSQDQSSLFERFQRGRK